jgi:3-methyladenine DNA glycosylase Mpg
MEEEMKSCRHWSVIDEGEYCRGAKKMTTCVGVEIHCNYLKYFNQPAIVCKRLRAKDRIEATAAEARV